MIRVLQGYCLVLENVKITCYNETNNGYRIMITNDRVTPTVFSLSFSLPLYSKRQLVLSTVSSSRMIDNVSCLFGSKQVYRLCCNVYNNIRNNI